MVFYLMLESSNAFLKTLPSRQMSLLSTCRKRQQSSKSERPQQQAWKQLKTRRRYLLSFILMACASALDSTSAV
jgi:hypothetical protein